MYTVRCPKELHGAFLAFAAVPKAQTCVSNGTENVSHCSSEIISSVLYLVTICETPVTGQKRNYLNNFLKS